MPRLHNNKFLKPIRKLLRNQSTAAEATLWKMLNKGQVGGLKFRRQHSVGKFILDFYCSKLRLCIELDGEVHANLSQIQKEALSAITQYMKDNEGATGEELHTAIHDIKKEKDIDPRDLFSAIYLSILGKESGPQAGWFLSALDRTFVLKRLEEVTT